MSEACAAALAAGCAPGVDYEGEYLVDWTQKLGDPTIANPTIHSCFSFAAQMVVIDRESGIDKVVAVHDVGKAVNPMLVEGQIEGSVHMGLGYALSEDFPTDRDRLPDEHDAAFARHPASQGRPGDGGDDRRGAPTAVALRHQGCRRDRTRPDRPAVAAALHDLDGEWRTSLPMRRGDPDAPDGSDPRLRQ